MDHLFKKYPMGYFAVLTPHEPLVETVSHIGRWTFYQRFMELSVGRWTTRTLLKNTAIN